MQEQQISRIRIRGTTPHPFSFYAGDRTMIFKKSYEQAMTDVQTIIDDTVDILDERIDHLTLLASVGIAVGAVNAIALLLIYKELAK